MKRLIACLFFVVIVNVAFASVDTVDVFSNAMHKKIKTVVITPSSYKKKKNIFPVVYLLHGFAGDYSNWINKVPQIEQYANEYQLLIICPDGGYGSWYLDSPIDSTFKYETFVSEELISFIDNHYRTINNAKARAITGLSMGGHGGLFLGLRHADLFGACGSMSGGVDLHYSTQKFDVAKRIGDTLHYASNWNDYSVLYLIEKFRTTQQKIIFDCGVDDFFYNDNKALHTKMLQLKIAHDYIERPGKHNWNYWSNAVQYQLLFFSNYFKDQQLTIAKKVN
jgi:S-formylglutathione hydrolase FrmB